MAREREAPAVHRALVRIDVAVADADRLDIARARVGEQRIAKAGELAELLRDRGLVRCDRSDLDAAPAQICQRMIQLDELISAVASAVRGSGEHEQQAVRPGQVREAAHPALLIAEVEVRKTRTHRGSALHPEVLVLDMEAELVHADRLAAADAVDDFGQAGFRFGAHAASFTAA
jgi:hypothetical protein